MMIGVAQVMGMKPTLRFFLLQGAGALSEHLGRRLEGEELRNAASAAKLRPISESAASGVLREQRAHHAEATTPS